MKNNSHGRDKHILEPVMIRSMIGIVCVLVLLTTCVESTAAQPLGISSINSLRDQDAWSVTKSGLRGWIEIADRGLSQRMFSSDAYHDDFRFRAAPVKRSANWQMPIVDVRCAKQIAVENVRSKSVEETSRSIVMIEISRSIEWLFKKARSASNHFTQLRIRFEQITLAMIPHPNSPNKIAASTSNVDYWNYYADCDRWNVVFAIARQRPPRPAFSESGRWTKRSWALSEFSRRIWSGTEKSWEEVTSIYRHISMLRVAEAGDNSREER